MNVHHFNPFLIKEMLENCRYVLRHLGRSPEHDRQCMFQLNMLLLTRLRLINPIRDQGDRGLLKVNYLLGEYYYSLTEIYEKNIVEDAVTAVELLLPRNAIYGFLSSNQNDRRAFTIHCPPYTTITKLINPQCYVNFQICIVCLEFLLGMVKLHSAKDKAKS